MRKYVQKRRGMMTRPIKKETIHANGIDIGI